MPWAASTVYLPDTRDTRAVVSADPALAGHVYALDLGGVELPPRYEGSGRLLAVRSPGRARDLTLLPDGFDYQPLDGVLAPRLAAWRSALEGPSARLAPADRQLRWLEDLAARAAAPVAWYMAEADEGAPDAEIAWVLDGGASARVGDEEIARVPTVYTRRARAPVAIAEGRGRKTARDPLGAALLHLGVVLDGPWFTPHRPGFDWSALRLG